MDNGLTTADPPRNTSEGWTGRVASLAHSIKKGLNGAQGSLEWNTDQLLFSLAANKVLQCYSAKLEQVAETWIFLMSQTRFFFSRSFIGILPLCFEGTDCRGAQISQTSRYVSHHLVQATEYFHHSGRGLVSASTTTHHSKSCWSWAPFWLVVPASDVVLMWSWFYK